MKYMAIIDADEKPVSCEFIGCNGNVVPYLIGATTDIKALEQEPIRPKGHWINKHRLFDSCSAECSSCHKRSNGYMHDTGFGLVSTLYDFCPNCGSDNREVEG